MRCPSCGHDNLDTAPACARCATPLAADHAGAGEPPFPAGGTSTAGSRPDDPAGTTLGGGRYRIVRLLGEGAKKRVYLAHDTLLDRDVAIALIKTEDLDATGLARLRAEVRAMGQLGDHPHIVTIHDVGEEGTQPFIVSQYMAGGDVARLLAAAPAHRLSLPEALRIADHVCRALEHAHGHGIVHRDLKPANVWLSDDGVAKLGDFGLAITTGRSRVTMAGTMLGTAAYMPPEQALGHEVDARSDLYSLGAMLYELTAGRPPFVGESPVAVVSQHINAAPAAPSRHNPDLPATLDALVLQLLAKTPAERPATAAAVRRSLHDIAAAQPAGTAPPRAPHGDAATATVDLDTAAVPAPPVRRLGALRRPGLGRRGALWLLLTALIVIETAFWLSRVRENGTGETAGPAGPGRPVVVGVMGFESHGPSPDTDWMSRRTRDSLNTILSRFDELKVYAKEKIDFVREKRGLREIEAAQELGITKMISGTVSVVDDTVTLEVRVVDIPSGFLDASIPGERRKDELIDLQNDAAVGVLRALHVPLDPERVKRTFAHRTNDMRDGYDLLYGTLGSFAEEPARGPAAPPPSQPQPAPPLSWLFSTATAHAAEAGDAAADTSPDEASIRELLERYRIALEAESIDDLALLHVEMTDAQRQALGRYFESADALKVRLSGIDVVVEGDEALATFTREDVFTDARSGREVHLEVRVSSLLAKEDGVWKIRGLKRPS